MKRLRRWLKDSGTSQVALAKALDVAPPTLSEWLKGDCLPSASSLMSLSRETGLTVDELLEGCGPQVGKRGPQSSRTAA